MSQDLFAAVLAALLAVAAAAVYAYIYVNAVDQPAVRTALTLGVTRVPWARLWAARPRLRLGGGHRAPAVESIRDWLADLKPNTPFVLAFDGARPDDVMVFERHGSGALRQVHPELIVPDLDVRVAEILAHREDGNVIPPSRTAEGATEEWSPTAEVAAAAAPPTIAHRGPDAEERAILAELDRLAADWRTMPDYLQEWAKTTDAHLEAAGLNPEPHQRWRAGVLEFPTSELPLALVFAR